MFQPKPISRDSIASVLKKAEHYRLLNEALEAECICLDVIELEPDNQKALYVLILAIADQLERRPAEKTKEAQVLLGRIADAYEKEYLGGIVCERRAKADMKRQSPGSGQLAYEWFRDAMDHFERAIDLAPDGNDDAVLRWNTCARILNRNQSTLVPPQDAPQNMLE